MARKTLTDRRKEAQQEPKAIHEKMAKLDRETSERIGRLAIKTVFADLAYGRSDKGRFPSGHR